MKLWNSEENIMHCFAFVFTCDYAPDKHMVCGGKMNIK